MKIKKTVCVAAVSALFAMFSAIGNATVITSLTNTLSFSWSKSTIDGNLTGTGSLAVSGFGTYELFVDVILNNTSLDSTDRLTSFGFGIDPNATRVAFSDATDGGMINAVLDATFPAISAIEICALGGSTCAGGGPDGILGGASDSFRISLFNETYITTGHGKDKKTDTTQYLWGNSVNIDPIGFKYQTTGDSYEFTTSSSSSSSTGSTGGSTGTTGQTIPEPGILGLLGIGLVGQALLMRQRRRRLQN